MKTDSTIYDRTVCIMRESGLTIERIAEDTGLPKEWLVSFRLQRIASPGIGRVEKLYEYLTGKRLADALSTAPVPEETAREIPPEDPPETGARRLAAYLVNELLRERAEAGGEVTEADIKKAIHQAVVTHTWHSMAAAGEVYFANGFPVWIEDADAECEIMDAEELDAAIREAVDNWPDARLH